MDTFKRVVAAVDLSDVSVPLVWQMLWLGHRLGARVQVLFVWTPPVYFVPDPVAWFPRFRPDRAEKIAHDRADAVLADMLSPISDRGLLVERVVRAGVPGPTICEFTRDPDCVLGIATRRRSLFSRPFLGSVTKYVLRQASCPVMTFHPDQLPVSSEVLGPPLDAHP
jgi:nucleotide-binding universal stress UspA family protein